MPPLTTFIVPEQVTVSVHVPLFCAQVVVALVMIDAEFVIEPEAPCGP
ncbi:MAG TPA: hypothetical protein VFC24_10420 [Casimicrobiaceae bacterium]|nr:hypothetical protein [Casimicrobiaceae bacterium]